MATLLRLLSLIVPREHRPRWREEWLAEMQHGGPRMITGALPDAWTLRRLSRQSEARSRRGAPIFHALDQDIRYALRGFSSGKGFTVAVVGSLAIGIAATTTGFALCMLGAIGAMTVGMLLQSHLYGVSPVDPRAFGGATLLLLGTMIVSSLAPARRASRVDPIQVLRTE